MKKSNPRIAATLKYGPSQPLILVVIMRIMFYVGMVMCGISFLLFMLGHFGVLESDGESALIPAAVFFVLSCVPLIILIPRAVVEKKIRLWLRDAVPLTAKSQTVAVREIRARVTYKAIKISVKFFYNGEKHIQASGNPEKHNETNGFSQAYFDYTNREIKILYSPSYDQVMILWEDKLNTK